MMQVMLFNQNKRMSDEIELYSFLHEIKDIVFLGRKSSAKLEQAMGHFPMGLLSHF